MWSFSNFFLSSFSTEKSFIQADKLGLILSILAPSAKHLDAKKTSHNERPFLRWKSTRQNQLHRNILAFPG